MESLEWVMTYCPRGCLHEEKPNKNRHLKGDFYWCNECHTAWMIKTSHTESKKAITKFYDEL